MIQVIFLALLIVTLLAGAFAYYNPSQNTINPMKFMMDNSGYNTIETLNQKKTRQINMTTSRGLLQIQKKLDSLAVEQNKFLDTIQDQQQILKAANKDASDILFEAQKTGEKGNNDILQLESLTSEMQDEQRLLVTRGQDLITLNDQLTQSRQAMAEQLYLANFNTDSALHSLQQRYVFLNDQATGFFDKVNQYNQEASDRIDKMRSKLDDMFDKASDGSAVQLQRIKDHIQQILDHEHDTIIILADRQQRYRDLSQDVRENLEDSKEQLDDSLRRNRDLIEEERQKEEDLQARQNQ